MTKASLGVLPDGSVPPFHIGSFDDLLRAARHQPGPQRLLFVFAGADLPEDHTPQQRRQFAAGAGGTLTPLMCVDKAPDEIGHFSDLVDESRSFGPEWAIVFVAALGGRNERAPTSTEADEALQQMVEAIKSGSHGSYIPFDHDGRPVVFG